jgi:hypothetical protein
MDKNELIKIKENLDNIYEQLKKILETEKDPIKINTIQEKMNKLNEKYNKIQDILFDDPEFPPAHRLEEKVINIKDYTERREYLKKWIKYSRDNKFVDEKSLTMLEENIRFAEIEEKRNEVVSRILTPEVIETTIWMISKDGLPEGDLKKNIRAGIQEIMGPGGMTFSKDALPNDFVPSWKDQYPKEIVVQCPLNRKNKGD